MYVCMYVCIYLCTYIHAYTCRHIDTYDQRPRHPVCPERARSAPVCLLLLTSRPCVSAAAAQPPAVLSPTPARPCLRLGPGRSDKGKNYLLAVRRPPARPKAAAGRGFAGGPKGRRQTPGRRLRIAPAADGQQEKSFLSFVARPPAGRPRQKH